MGKRLVALCASLCAFLGAAAPASAAPVSVGHSGWVWGDPRPQGNTLVAIDFVEGRGYAAGAFGTLLRTDDQGANWTGVSTGLTDALSHVRMLDADTVLTGGRCALRRSDDGGESFTRLPWTSSDAKCPSKIASFFFPSSSTGYLVTADGSVFRTADGGKTFSRRTAVPGTQAASGGPDSGKDPGSGQFIPTDIHFVDDSTGIAVTTFQRGGVGRIFRTTDAGNSWAELEVSSPGPDSNTSTLGLRALTFVSATIGYAVGDGTTLLRSADGGATWTRGALTGAPPSLQLSSIDCASATICLIGEESGARLLRTGDGGQTATPITPSTNPIFAAAFATPSVAVAIGRRGATVTSGDSGVTWSPVGGAIAPQRYGPVNAETAQWAQAGGENGSIARTVDAGATWSLVGVPSSEFIRGTSFPSLNVGYALDSVGGVFKTTDGGATWTILDTGATGTPAAILALDPGQVLLAGAQEIRRSTDGGASFARVSDRDVSGASIVGLDVAGGSLIAFGSKTLVRSADAGATWSRIRLPAGLSRVADADFVSEEAGYPLERGSKLWRTTNGGRGWRQLPALAPMSANGISFSSATSGFVSGGTQIGTSGYALHTTDGGAIFEPQLVSDSRSLSVADVGTAAFAGAANGSFFATSTGGHAGTASTLTLDLLRKRASGGRLRNVTVDGKLDPSEGGEKIAVSLRPLRGTKWESERVTAASNGGFTARLAVPGKGAGPVAVVAQWRGDDDRSGAGSKPLIVR